MSDSASLGLSSLERILSWRFLSVLGTNDSKAVVVTDVVVDSADVDENVEVVVEMVTLSLPTLAKGNFIFRTLITGFEDETSGADDIDIKGLSVVDVVNTPLLDPDKECKAK